MPVIDRVIWHNVERQGSDLTLSAHRVLPDAACYSANDHTLETLRGWPVT
jgi:hypothetical protein